MYVFTHHEIGKREAPLVAVFEEIPTIRQIAEALAVTVPIFHVVEMEFVYETEGMGQMLPKLKEILEGRKARGEWPSIGKVSSDGKMYFSFQLIP